MSQLCPVFASEQCKGWDSHYYLHSLLQVSSSPIFLKSQKSSKPLKPCEKNLASVVRDSKSPHAAATILIPHFAKQKILTSSPSALEPWDVHHYEAVDIRVLEPLLSYHHGVCSIRSSSVSTPHHCQRIAQVIGL